MALIPVIVGMSLLVILLVGGGIWLMVRDKARARQPDDSLNPKPTKHRPEQVNQESGQLPFTMRPKPEAPPGNYFNGGCMLLFGLFWTSFSLLFLIMPLVMFWQEWQDYLLLKNSGVTTEAVVIDRRVDYDSEGDSYYVTYQFTAPLPQGDQQRFSREQSVSDDTYATLPPETRVAVVYAPADPTVSRLQSGLGPPFFLLFIAALGGLFTLVGLVLLIGGWQGLNQSSKLARQGQLIQATVLDRWVDKDSEDDPVYCVAYEFTLPGRPRLTKAEYNRAAYDSLAIGDPVTVRYLPDRPDVCRLEL